MNIIAVVVTYNRIELLKRTIHCLRQNKPVTSIVVVNNGSTDATADFIPGCNMRIRQVRIGFGVWMTMFFHVLIV